MGELNSIENLEESQTQSKSEFLDAIRRHICQILGFDYGFIDIISGHEISNVAKFCFEDEDDVAGEFVESLVDENKQPVTVANTLVAQKVKQTRKIWVGKAFAQEDIEKGIEEESEGFPYIIVPVLDTIGSGEVTGLIRVISFDGSRENTSQDLTTLKLMGEHLASRTGLFGNVSLNATVTKQSGQTSDRDDHVLVVHSNRLVRRRFNRILGSGYSVAEAETGERALDYIDQNRVDVILLDSELQGASGFGFCKVLKESSNSKHIPVILVIADNSTTARVEGLNVGADDCIPDSCLDAELLARVRSSLRHRKTERELAVQLQLLEDYAQRLEKAHEQLSIDRQTTIQRNSQLEQLKREGDVQRHQDNLLHRISNMIRKSFNIHENLEEMLEALSGWFSLDCAFIVMPNEEEPEDTLRVECVSDKNYRVVAYDRDLDIYEVFKKHMHHDQAIISNDAATDRRLDPFHKILKSGFTVQSLFFIPVTYEQKLQGLLVGYKCETRANWSRINESFMKSVVDQVAVGVVNARLYARVQRQATTDGLTDLFNHRTGQEKLADQLKQAERYERRLSVIMLDVDHFKSINDKYGHPAGDSVLKTVARLIRQNCRDVDIPVRYGGEEFLIVLPEITQDGAIVVAERLRNALKQESIEHEELTIRITSSLGVASFPDDADNQQTLLDLADKSLYLSKRLGRDQVHTASDLMFESESPEKQEKTSEAVAHDLKSKSEAGKFTPPMISEEAREHEELVPEVVDMVKSLAASLYAKSEYNKQHHLEVARMSELLAKVMGLSAQQVEQIRVAGLLHDVGVLQLPQELLHKEGKLSDEERELVNQHATLGAQMLRPVRALKDICEILENHHERWDGTGYPRGLKGEEIPLPARIVGIVDSYHAMISERPYRPAMSHDDAVKVLKEGAGKQWDPFLIEIFSAVMKSMRETTQEVQAKVAMAARGAAKQAAQAAQTKTDATKQDEPKDADKEKKDVVVQEKAESGEEVTIEAEQRNEPSKISSIIGPVIKPIGPRLDDVETTSQRREALRVSSPSQPVARPVGQLGLPVSNPSEPDATADEAEENRTLDRNNDEPAVDSAESVKPGDANEIPDEGKSSKLSSDSETALDDTAVKPAVPVDSSPSSVSAEAERASSHSPPAPNRSSQSSPTPEASDEQPEESPAVRARPVSAEQESGKQPVLQDQPMPVQQATPPLVSGPTPSTMGQPGIPPTPGPMPGQPQSGSMPSRQFDSAQIGSQPAPSQPFPGQFGPAPNQPGPQPQPIPGALGPGKPAQIPGQPMSPTGQQQVGQPNMSIPGQPAAISMPGQPAPLSIPGQPSHPSLLGQQPASLSSPGQPSQPSIPGQQPTPLSIPGQPSQASIPGQPPTALTIPGQPPAPSILGQPPAPLTIPGQPPAPLPIPGQPPAPSMLGQQPIPGQPGSQPASQFSQPGQQSPTGMPAGANPAQMGAVPTQSMPPGPQLSDPRLSGSQGSSAPPIPGPLSPAGAPGLGPQPAPMVGQPPNQVGGLPPELPGGPRPQSLSNFQGYQPPPNQEPFGQLIQRDTPGQAPTRHSGEIAGLPEKTGFAVPTNTSEMPRPGAPQPSAPSAPSPPSASPGSTNPARQIGGPTAQPWPPIPTNQPPDSLPHPQLPPSHPRNSPGVSYTHLQAFPGPRTGPPQPPPGSIRNQMLSEQEESPAPLPGAQAPPGSPGAVYTSLPAMQPTQPAGSMPPTADLGQTPAGYMPPQPSNEQYPQQQPGYTMGQMPPQAMPGALGPGGAPPAIQPMGYPRPYAAGHPMAAQDVPSAQVMQQRAPAPAPNAVPPLQSAPSAPTQIPAPPTAPPQPSYQSGFQAAANAHAQRMAKAPEVKQPDTWDPSADYDDEDEISGDL